MTEEKRYKVVYDPRVYPAKSEPEGEQMTPERLRKNLEGVGARIYFGSSKRKFVSISIPEEKLGKLRSLEGILRIIEDKIYDSD
jgi:hypothetical protein